MMLTRSIEAIQVAIGRQRAASNSIRFGLPAFSGAACWRWFARMRCSLS